MELEPEAAGAYYVLRGILYAVKGDHDHALADFDKAIQLDPQQPSTYNVRGDSYIGKGDYDRAIANYDKAIQLTPR